MSTLPSPPEASLRSELGDPAEAGARSGASGADDPDFLPPDPRIRGRGRAFGRQVNRSGGEASNQEARRVEAEEDRELISLARQGDKTAFRALVERHQQRAFTIAVGLTHDENDARELVQEAFLRAHRGLDAFQGASSFSTWLYRIVTNLAIDLKRKPDRREVELDEERATDGHGHGDFALVSRIDGADPLDVMRRREIAARIQTALEALPAIHRVVVLMREVDGMSYEEMAQAAGVSKGTIMSRLFHARQKLQRALADCYAEDVRKVRSAADGPEKEVS